MTPLSDPRTPDAVQAPQPYGAPEMTALGSVEAITAGPDKSPEKNIDMIIGSDGGFFDRDATS